MSYLISRLCRDCVDTGCVSVCPVDCIYAYTGPDVAAFPSQLYINPDECIDCGACEPECPWRAIFEEVAMPPQFEEDIAIAYRVNGNLGEFEVAKHVVNMGPTIEGVRENERKWGLEPL